MIFAPILKAWNWFNGKKTLIASGVALGQAMFQSFVIDEFSIQSDTWTHASSLLTKLVVYLGGVGLVHKGVKVFTNKGQE